MNLSKKIVFSLFVLLSNLSFDCLSQHYISASTGVCAGKLFNLKSEYPSEKKYQVKGGFSFSLVLDSLNRDKNLRLGLEYGQQNLGIYERSYDKWGAGTTSNCTIHFQYFQVDLDYKFKLLPNPKYSLFLFTGPTFSLSNKVIVNGFGKSTTFVSVTDTAGDWHPMYSTDYWQKVNEKTTDFAKYNFGVNLGLTFIYPLTQKINLILENKYTLLLKNTTDLDNSVYTFYIRSGLSFGARFRM